METSTEVSAEAIQAQLQRILASPGSLGSYGSFPEVTIEKTIAGQDDQLKEITLGLEVFDKTSSFDPRTDTIVRVEARRLRSKLKEYYEIQGQQDLLLIQFPKGGYVPTFLLRNGNGAVPSVYSRVLISVRQSEDGVSSLDSPSKVETSGWRNQ